MTKKNCFKCKERKSLSEFYRHKQMADGHLGKCKKCQKKDSTKHRWANIDKVRRYDRERALQPDRLENHIKQTKKYRKKFPLRYKATRLLNNAVRDGKLVRPKKCSVCKEAGRQIEAHHDDYTKPLKVKWVCSICHKRIEMDLLRLSGS